MPSRSAERVARGEAPARQVPGPGASLWGSGRIRVSAPSSSPAGSSCAGGAAAAPMLTSPNGGRCGSLGGAGPEGVRKRSGTWEVGERRCRRRLPGGQQYPRHRPCPRRPGPVWRNAGNRHGPHRPARFHSPRCHLGFPSALAVESHRRGGPAFRGEAKAGCLLVRASPDGVQGPAGRDAGLVRSEHLVGSDDLPPRCCAQSQSLSATAHGCPGRAGERMRRWSEGPASGGPSASHSVRGHLLRPGDHVPVRLNGCNAEPCGQSVSPPASGTTHRASPGGVTAWIRPAGTDRATDPEGRCVSCARRPVSPVPSPA